MIARNAEAAEKTVDQIVTDIKHGTVDPQIEQAALATKLNVKYPSSKASRDLNHDPRDVTSKLILKGPQGLPHAPSRVAQHIISGGRIPEKIQAALVASKHYLRPGQTPADPTAPPKSKPGKPLAGPTTSPKGTPGQKDEAPPPDRRKHYSGRSRTQMAPGVSRARASSSKLIGTQHLEGLEIQDFRHQLYSRAVEVRLTHAELQALIRAAQKDPDAEQAIYHALTMDPDVEKVTKGLIQNWTSSEDLEKRGACVDGLLEVREEKAEAEAKAETEADLSFSEQQEA